MPEDRKMNFTVIEGSIKRYEQNVVPTAEQHISDLQDRLAKETDPTRAQNIHNEFNDALLDLENRKAELQNYLQQQYDMLKQVDQTITKDVDANVLIAMADKAYDTLLATQREPVSYKMLMETPLLNVGDIIVAGTTVGRVRAMSDDKGNKVKSAGPSVPVEITGLDSVPTGGDVFNSVSDERLARELVDQRKTAQKEEKFNARTKVTLDNLFDQMKLEDMKELKIIVKAQDYCQG